VKETYRIGSDNDVSLKYQDDEQDWVTIATNSDLRLAFDISKDKILKLTVQVIKGQEGKYRGKLQDFTTVTVGFAKTFYCYDVAIESPGRWSYNSIFV
jgi:hypothetical protein